MTLPNVFSGRWGLLNLFCSDKMVLREQQYIIVKVANSERSPKQLKRSIKHLFPLEVHHLQVSDEDTPVRREEPESYSASGSATMSTRPRRVAAITGEIIRRINQN